MTTRADAIASLPVIQDRPLTSFDKAILNTIQDQTVSTLKWRHTLLPTLVFIILSLPMMDTFIHNNLTESFWMALAMKTLLFLVVLVVILRT